MAPIVTEPVVAAAVDPDLRVLRLEELVGSLRMWLALVGVLTVAAFGVALYAALADNSSGAQNGSRRGLASDERVSRVNARVDRLNSEVKGLRAGAGSGAGVSATDASALGARLDALDRQVKTIAARPAAADQTQALSALSGRIDSLMRDVGQLKQGAAQTRTTP